MNNCLNLYEKLLICYKFVIYNCFLYGVKLFLNYMNYKKVYDKLFIGFVFNFFG